MEEVKIETWEGRVDGAWQTAFSKKTADFAKASIKGLVFLSYP